MKKFGMVFFSGIIIVSTILIYIYQYSNSNEINIIRPKIEIKSDRFGSIENIEFYRYAPNKLLFLASSKNQNSSSATSSLYAADIKTGNVDLIFKTESHKNLENFLMVSQFNNYVCMANPMGMIAVQVLFNEDKVIPGQVINYDIPNFSDAGSAVILSSVAFTKPNKKLLYTNQLHQNSSFFSFNSPETGKTSGKNYLINPFEVIHINNENLIFYTKKERNGLNLYSTHLSPNGAFINESLINKNVVSVSRGFFIDDDIACITEEVDSYKLRYNKDTIDSIPKNNSLLNEPPTLAMKRHNNNNYKILYTKYTKDHLGSIFLKNELDAPREIIKDLPIIGPVKYSGSGESIIFFTLENNEIRVKYSSISGEGIKDITNIFK